ncbi:MAG: glycosyl transferase family 28 [Chitinophagaceae bacterium]|nr:glycosyl transferase family 28 [Chitinophagaceae bacterium]MCW5906025.1 glycosyl transferase family 28 [Chitinophagaceae bacterium]
MNKKFNIQTILVAPLDWGLGHATRCIPIIQTLLNNGYTVIIAATGKQKILLQQEFPSITFIELKGYQISYSKSKFFLPLKIITQIPTILSAIRYEHQWLKKVVEQYHIDLVISDNRYGLYHSTKPCVFITHQLTIKMPFYWLEKLVQKINYRFINQFSACWVPDFEGENNLAGVLSHPQKMPTTPVHYIGLLSRFSTQEVSEIKYDYCIVLSGPEPQRTILEEKILAAIDTVKATILLVRGKPDSQEIFSTPKHITIKNHLANKELNIAMQQSNYIICRSGYTTVMEVLSLQKKSILIPTPGQTEQEYLAKKLMQQQWCYSVEQQYFSLQQIISTAENNEYDLPTLQTNSLATKIAVLLKSL